MRSAVFVALAFVPACLLTPPSVITPTSCLLDDDCGGRTPFCVESACVECVRDNDCDDDEVCDDDGICDVGVSEGEGDEGEGDVVGEGEGDVGGEGEGDVGEGEGEGDDGSVSCDLDAVCDGGEACVSINSAFRYCFERCASEGDTCDNVWGQAGRCSVIDEQLVCVASGEALSVCSSFGNSRCGDADLDCVEVAPAVAQCLPDCVDETDCAGFTGCFDFDGDGAHCLALVDEGDRCGFIDDDTWRFCQFGLACDFLGGLPTGHCGVDADDDGLVDEPTGGDPVDDGGGSHTPGGGGGGGEGEGEGEDEDVPCGTSSDCVIASFASHEECADNADCNGGDVNSANQVCLRDSLGNTHCALRSQNEIRCEQMPVNPRLTTTPGTDIGGVSVGFCALPTGVFCNVATDVCQGGAFN